MMASSILLATYALFVGISQSEITQQDRNQIQQLTTTFGYTSTDFVNGRITEQQLIDFYDAYLTPDFIINFGGFEVSGLEPFKEFYISILKTQKSLNNVPGAVNYVSIADDEVVVRNNEIVTSFDKATDTLPEMFESIHFTNIWTLTREQPYEENIFKLKYFQFHIDVRFPDIPIQNDENGQRSDDSSDDSSDEIISAMHVSDQTDDIYVKPNNITINISNSSFSNLLVMSIIFVCVNTMVFACKNRLKLR